MNEEIQIKIIELIDGGATLTNSPQLRELLDSSEEAQNFYKNILKSESTIEDFFAGDRAKELSNKIDTYIEEQLDKTSTFSSINFKPIVGFAVAASMAAIAFTFFDSPSNISESIEIPYEEPQIAKVEEAEPIFMSGEDMVNGLWGPSSDLARELGRNRYEIMYVVYEANKDHFINNNINQPKQDETFFVDLSLVESLEPDFVIDEVKRHIFCSC